MDFGPTRAKMEGQEPYLPPDLWDMFPDELVDSELGEIPEGWEVEPLGEIIELAYGEALKAGVKGGNPKSATVADLPGNLGRDLAEAEAAIADTKQAYYDALNQRHRAIRALARETNQ